LNKTYLEEGDGLDTSDFTQGGKFFYEFFKKKAFNKEGARFGRLVTTAGRFWPRVQLKAFGATAAALGAGLLGEKIDEISANSSVTLRLIKKLCTFGTTIKRFHFLKIKLHHLALPLPKPLSFQYKKLQFKIKKIPKSADSNSTQPPAAFYVRAVQQYSQQPSPLKKLNMKNIIYLSAKQIHWE